MTRSLSTRSAIGVIGTGAMGLGVVQSLVRAGFPVRSRDIRPEAQSAAAAAGAVVCATPAQLARQCSIVILLVVDAPQVETVLFGEAGAAAQLKHGSVVIVSSTVAPASMAALKPRLSNLDVRLIDAPVSGGPRRAADATMTMMISGDPDTIEECKPIFHAISAKRFILGSEPGDAAAYKILNNQLAAVNLAAGAEAITVALARGLDPQRLLEVVNASSGGSWIVADRMARALAGDHATHAASKILSKDVGLAVDAASALGVDVPLARAARERFAAALAAGYAEADDCELLRFCCELNSVRWPRGA